MNDDKGDDEITPQESEINEDFQKTCVQLRECLADANRLVQHLRDLDTIVHVGEDLNCKLRVTVNGADTRDDGFGQSNHDHFRFEPTDDGGMEMVLPLRYMGDEQTVKKFHKNIRKSVRAQETRVRRKLRKAGLALRKCHLRGDLHADDNGEYMIIDVENNACVGGERYDCTLDEAEAYADAESAA